MIADAHSRQSLFVLLADDSRVSSRLTASILEKLGHRCRVVSDGRAAVEAWRDVRFDLILMGHYMPGMTGLEAAREIRRLEPAEERVPIVSLTATVDADALGDSSAHAVDDWLAKPFTAAALHGKLARWAARSGSGPRD